LSSVGDRFVDHPSSAGSSKALAFDTCPSKGPSSWNRQAFPPNAPISCLVKRIARSTAARKTHPIPFRPKLAYAVDMAISDKRKQSLYFPEEMLKEIGAEATRQDRSLSWIVQKAWKAARKEIMNIPSVGGVPDDKDGAK
jgi:uncharacterized small protein (TIGR04563 family)